MDAIISFIEGIRDNNVLTQWIAFFTVIVLLFVVARIVKSITGRKSIRKIATRNPVSAALLHAVSRSITFILLALGVWIGLKILAIPDESKDLANLVSKIIITISIGYFAYYLADLPSVWFEFIISKSERNLNQMFVPVIRKTLRVVIVLFVFLQIIQMLSNKPITTIVAGLGIGGLAVALASQDTIKHFIGSFVIAGDQPFEIGDRVVIDGHDGPVESIGLRSTRIRTLNGHLVSIPNGELANRTVLNIGKRPYIKREMNIGITYDTKPEKIRKALEIVKEILDNHEGMNEEFPPKVYFSDLKSDYLNIIALYWYHPPDYWQYMDFSEKVNMQLIERFNKEGIEFAFPTQTIHLKKENEAEQNT
ncbi:MAG: mechanosensitive ion channel family protein [Bacteroidales bacterium]|jgi:MscS family membrane protein